MTICVLGSVCPRFVCQNNHHYRDQFPRQRSFSFARSVRKERNVTTRGILDTYRRDKALAERDQAQKTADPAEEGTCSAECVRDIYEVKDLEEVLESAGDKTLTVVDFYKTACGSCRYIQPGFVKLCRASEAEHAEVIFLRHNIFDEYEELSELAQKYKIRAVPLFIFFKGNAIVDSFATRERRRIAKAINTHAGYKVLDPS